MASAKQKEKACKMCKTIYLEEDKCPNCGSKESTESFKGRIVVINPEKSEIAQKLNIPSKGNFAIKTR
jgi:DNA-directed RNA polymerase subunit E"